MRDKWLEILRETHKYLTKLLRRLRKAQEAIPEIDRILQRVEWEIEALETAPEEVDEIVTLDLTPKLGSDLNYLKINLPMLPEYGVKAVQSSSGISTSGTISVYEHLSRMGDLQTSHAIEFSNRITVTYQELQEEQRRPVEVRKLIALLGNDQTLNRYDRAASAYHAAARNTGERTAAALEMRTLLDGIQGDLFQKARNTAKENMTWSLMAQRLSKGSAGGHEEVTVISQEMVRSSLINRLSQIGKDREGTSVTNIRHIWTQLLDHIYTVLSLLDQ